MSHYGEMLKTWRKARDLSQLSLSGLTGVSQRYLSYLETGKSHPSRAMLTALCDALDVPKSVRRQMLQVCDYATPALDDQSNETIFSVTLHNLKNLVAIQQPVPAMLVDSLWNIVSYNSGLDKLLGLFGSPNSLLAQSEFNTVPNLLKLFFLATSLCSHVKNGSVIGRASLAKLNRQAQQQPENTQLQQLVEELRHTGTTPKDWWQYPENSNSEAGELLLQHEVLQLRLAVMVSAFQYDEPEQWRIITFLPLDEASHQILEVPLQTSHLS